VKKGTWTAVIAVAELIGFGKWGIAGLIIAIPFWAIPYLISCAFNPRARHTGWRGCGGTGEVRSALFPWSHHRCNGCQSGRTIRVGARFVGPDYAKKEWQSGKKTRERRKQARRWR
jgi:hypothetical protein